MDVLLVFLNIRFPKKTKPQYNVYSPMGVYLGSFLEEPLSIFQDKYPKFYIELKYQGKYSCILYKSPKAPKPGLYFDNDDGTPIVFWSHWDINKYRGESYHLYQYLLQMPHKSFYHKRCFKALKYFTRHAFEKDGIKRSFALSNRRPRIWTVKITWDTETQFNVHGRSWRATTKYI